MQIQKTGGDYQLTIEQPDDLANIGELDPAHWMATSAPCGSFTCDQSFLDYLDSDGNGKVRSNEVCDAQAWLFRMLCDRSRLVKGSDVLRLDAIDCSHADGRALRAAAERILANIGAGGGDEITLAQVRNRRRIVAAGTCNGDGVIPATSVDDADLAAFIRDIVASVGGTKDAGGHVGVTQVQARRFVEQSQKYLAWRSEADPAPESSGSILVLADDTEAAFASLRALEDRIDDFYHRCWLVRHNTRFGVGGDIRRGDGDDDDDAGDERLSLALPEIEETLYFDDRVHPAEREALARFRELVLRPLFPDHDHTSLPRSLWIQVQKRFEPYASWQARKEGSEVENIPRDALQRYVSGDYSQRLQKLIDHDRSVASEIELAGAVEKLVLYQQWFLRFVNNFVSFSCLFDPTSASMIQAGCLIMDGRRFDLTMKVYDRAFHKKVVEQSNICVMYLTVTRKDTDADMRMEIAAAVTSGTMGRLFPGKAGVFFTPDGREWDAIIVDFVANPVSIAEAIRKPFKQFGDFMRKQMERFSTAGYQQVEAQLGKGIVEVEETLKTGDGKPAESAQPGGGTIRDMMLSGSVAAAALGSAFAFVTKTLQNVSIWEMASVVFGLAVIVFAPIIIVALLKLRHRNLSIFIEACGWAINGQMRLSIQMGLLFTREPGLPPGVYCKPGDRIRQLARQVDLKRRSWLLWILCLVIVIVTGIFLAGRYACDAP